MLQSLNKYIGKWFVIGIVSLIALAFVLWGVEYYVQGDSGGNEAVAKVNGKKITAQQLQNVEQIFIRQEEQRLDGVPINDEQRKTIRDYALQGLIQETALQQAARKAGAYVGVMQAQEIVMSNPQFQQNGRFDPQLLESVLSANNLTPEQYMKNVQQNLLTAEIESGVASSALVLPTELQQTYQLFKQQRVMGYMLLPLSRYVSAAKVSEQDIKNDYTQNKTEFQTPEKISLDYIQLNPKTLASKITITENELQQYYQSNLVNFTIPKRWQIAKIEVSTKAAIDKIQQQLKSGKNFATVMAGLPAKDISTEWLSRAQVSQQVADFISGLKVKQISAPFKTSNGYAMVQLLDQEAAKTKPFADVKDRLRKVLLQQKLDKQLSSMNDTLSNLTYTNPNTLAPAAKALGVSVQTTGLFSKVQPGKKGIVADPRVIAAAFSADVLKQGNNSNPITLKDGSLLVLRVKQHIPSQLKPLAEVASGIRKKLTQQYAERQAGLVAYKIQTELGKGVNPQTLAKQYSTVWTEKTLSSDSKSVNPQIVQTAFGIKPKSSKSVLLKDGNYAIVYVSELKLADFNDLDTKQREKLSQNLTQMWGGLAYRLYVKSVMSHAKIKIYPQSD